MATDPLTYHEHPTPGKVSLAPTKPCVTTEDLALTYTPGVAQPCRAIADDPTTAYRYTSKGNVVAVISNGTSVLGLGNIGPLASKPVMEGKAVLFKRFADIDAVDLEIAQDDPHRLAEIIAALEPSFGGINLEDIKAPECFIVEEELRSRLAIPVFHDDQHGTAVVVAAALTNALTLTGKRLDEARITCSGAGAAAIAILTMLVTLGARADRILLYDSKGLVHAGREDLNTHKRRFAHDGPDVPLADALARTDAFIGVSKGDLLTPAMLARMPERPIIFALANPDPEIPYAVARAARPDAIVATGRSDHPNQVNNVLCFPFLFRAALDTRSPRITDAMKSAAVAAIAALAREPSLPEVERIYGATLRFGPEYLLPKPFDPRLLPRVAVAVARAAIDEGVATVPLDLVAYETRLERRSHELAQGKF